MLSGTVVLKSHSSWRGFWNHSSVCRTRSATISKSSGVRCSSKSVGPRMRRESTPRSQSTARPPRIDLDDLPARPEVAVPRPRRPDANVRDVLPRLAFNAVRPGCEVDLLESFEIVSSRFVGDALNLRGLLLVPADHERDARVA